MLLRLISGEKMRRSLVLACVLAVTVAAGGCDNGPTTGPTPPTTDPVTDTFTGALTMNGSTTHGVTTNAAGVVTATITALTPDGAVVGFQLGTFDGVTCTAVLSNDLATLASALQGHTQTAANLCVKVHDPNGRITGDPVNYTVTVTHF
jgi:hypothetical protein